MKNIIFKILGIITLIITLLFLYSIFKLNILNNTYLIIISLLTISLALLIVFKLFREKTRVFSKIIFSILSIILIIIYLISYIYINTTTNFIKNVTNKDNLEYKTYNVITLKKYNNLNDLKNKKIGFLTNNYVLAKKELKKKIEFTSDNYDNTDYLINSLYNKNDSISLEDNYLEMIKEENDNFLKDKNIIYKYKVAIKTKTKAKKLNINKPFIIYISGSDSRKNVKEVARSDVNIIVVINPKDHKLLMVSTPRDYYVQLHGTKGLKDKLTHAGVYGINTSVKTMEDLLDINIDRYIKVSFATVINVVDVIDGIDVYSEKAFTPRANKSCKIVKGNQHLNGACALAFSRERKTYASGDRHRGENQEQVLSKIIDKVTSKEYITKYNDILKAIDGSFETNASYNEITSIIKSQIDNPTKWQIETYNLDGTSSMGDTYTMVTKTSRYTHIMIPDESTITKAKEKINNYLEN